MPATIAALLRHSKEEVLDEWIRRVLGDPKVPAANQLSVTSLRDHLPDLLDHVVSALEAKAAADGAIPAAEAHAHERFHQRYSLEEALRELSHLRAVVVGLCAQHDVPLEGASMQIFHSLIDEAMITAAIEMEQAARADEALERERLRLVLSLLPVGVFIADARGCIVAANPAGERIWGAKPPPFAECKDFGVYQGWWADTGEKVAPDAWGLARAIHGEESLDEEIEILGFDGARRTILNSAMPLRDASGAILGGVAVNVDITDRKRAEIELRRDALFRERFIGVLGHDLRSPLASILLGTTALLRRRDLPELLQQSLVRISSSAQRMSRMINDLLDFTRVRNGGLPVQRKPADLLLITRQVIHEIEAAHPGRSIAFQYDTDMRGSWDPDRIAQVVSNLISNAVDHGPDDATVHVALRNEGDFVVLEIHNAGPPIPPEMLGLIFEPFRRVMQDATATTQASRGLGLGLFIVREIVLAHGGSIDVRSSADEGTTFTVRLRREG